MAGTVVLFVTRSGHSRRLAEALAAKLGTKAFEIRDRVSRKGLIGYMKSGSQAVRGLATPIEDPHADLSGADAIALVQPVWASAICPPLRTWLQSHKTELEGRKVGLLLSNKGSEGAAVKAKFEAEFGPLAAFDCLHESQPDSEKDAAMAAMCETLGRRK